MPSVEPPPIPHRLYDDDEPILFFFLRVPEVLGIPAGVAIPEYCKVDGTLMDYFEQNEWGGVPQSYKDRPRMADSGEFEQDAVIDLSNTYIQTSSAIMHHIELDLTKALGYDVLVEALRNGQPSNEGVAPEPSDLEVRGVSTVVEMAVPLHVALTLAKYELRETDHSLYPDVEHISDDQAREAFRYALNRVRNIQSGYHALRKNSAVTLLTEELLPPIIPYLARSARMIRDGIVVAPRSLMLHLSLQHVLPGEDLTGDELNMLGRSEVDARGNPRFLFLELFREAISALHRYGNTRTASIIIGIAAEEMLNNVLLSMLWEGGLTPEQSASAWNPALATRIKNEYASKLGGSWALNANNPVAEWSRKVAGLRNRCVHAGYVPTREEVGEAIRVTTELLTYIGDRLTHGGNLKKYVRTASQILGNEGLERRGRLTSWVRGVQNSPKEPDWSETFARWHAAHMRILGDKDRPRQADISKSWILAVIHPDGTVKWVAHDRVAAKACLVSVYPGEALDRAQEMIDAGRVSWADYLANVGAISIGMAEGSMPISGQVSDWVEEYRLVPMAGVMVDKSDLQVGI